MSADKTFVMLLCPDAIAYRRTSNKMFDYDWSIVDNAKVISSLNEQLQAKYTKTLVTIGGGWTEEAAWESAAKHIRDFQNGIPFV
jgi:hypothetical protein